MDKASAVVGARGYWTTLEEYSRRRQHSFVPGAGSAGSGGGAMVGGGALSRAEVPAQLWPHPFHDCSMGVWLFAPIASIHSHNK